MCESFYSGSVIVALNGSGYYEVYLHYKQGIRPVRDKVGSAELGELIGRHIEGSTNKEEYEDFCLRQRTKLFGGAV